MATPLRAEYMSAHPVRVIFDAKQALEKPWVEDLTNYETCPECKECPARIVEEYSSGDMVCDSCGFCLPGRIVCQETEWRHFSGENDADRDDPSRIGAAANPLLHGSQLQTTIGSSPAAARTIDNNNNDATTKHGNARTLQRAQQATMAVDANDKSNKKLQTRYSEISALCEGMALTRDVVITAQYYYKLVEEAKYLRGYKPIAVIAGCTISNPSSTGPTTTTTNTQHPSLTLLPRFSSHLQLSFKCECLASAICTASADVIPNLGSRHPASIAGVAIFMASHLLRDRRALKDVSKASGIGTQTIGGLYKVFWGMKKALLEAAGAMGKFDLGEDNGVERLPLS
ncbi:transcription initiation factor IIB [Peltigera leucophlebia]|nr:transcription initiation factor IIB [Peltigera leucophlebia]